ncbi:hypothetical protein HYG86_09225 [Alkalicella caledoniensis]|uniref:Uncharacterized protein n=1 Tax=Alkalicella caledoniensis TaxID=2731377 RepID=A0A7G9W8D0_ALKCA|nr:hypothetical protein [Alkalicella caledoniensis]QNO14942.1 hypothetical protein HYG86_09225 [Alkalicella caledoniensis]
MLEQTIKKITDEIENNKNNPYIKLVGDFIKVRFVEENDVENISTRELQKLLKERDEAIEAKEQAIKEKETFEEVVNNKDLTIEELQKQLELEKSLPIDEAIVESLENKIKDLEEQKEAAQTKIDDLTKELSGPAVLETAVVEKVPEEIEKELQELREKLSKASTETKKDESVIKFRVQFNSLAEGFKELLVTLGEIDDAETKNKYATAVNGLLNKMKNSLEG